MIVALLILAAVVAVWFAVGIIADHISPRRRRHAANRTTPKGDSR